MPRTQRARRVVASIGALTLVMLSFSATSRAATLADENAADSAASWLASGQQSNGGFEHSPFEGFETTDTVLAIAEAAQTGSAWSTSEAFDAVTALEGSGSGNPTPLDYLENLIDNATDKAVAAKNLVYVALPLGIDPTDFGGLNLVTEMGGCDGTATLGFNGFLSLVLAQEVQCGSAPAASLQAIRDGQQANGSWNYVPDPTLDFIDNDTTSSAIQALVAAGATASDRNVKKGLQFFAAQQQANGAWQSFGFDDPNSTAVTMLAIAAAGFDPTTSCWRDTVSPELTGTAYARPDVWLRGQQAANGLDAGSFGYAGSTFATSQSVQGLLRSWLPVARASSQVCTTSGPTPTVSNTAPTAGASFTVSGTGFMPGATLTVELHSDPVLLATVTADGTGAYSVVVTIPPGTPGGTHQLVVSGLGPDGQPRQAVTPLEVVVVTPSGSGSGSTSSGSGSGSGSTEQIPRFTG